MTTDLSDYIGFLAASRLSRLCTIKTFASRYRVSESGVIRHALKGDIPVIFIDDVPFVLDLGLKEFSRIGITDLHESHVQYLENMLSGKINNIRTEKPKRKRGTEVNRALIKDKSLKDSDYLTMGTKKETGSDEV